MHRILMTLIAVAGVCCVASLMHAQATQPAAEPAATPRTLTGKIIVPEGQKFDFKQAHAVLQGSPGEFKVPKNLEVVQERLNRQMRAQEMTIPRKVAWLESWQRTKDGQAYSQAIMEHQQRAYSSAQAQQVEIGTDGKLEVRNVAPGAYTLHVYVLQQSGDDGSARVLARAQKEITVAEGDSQTPVELGDLAIEVEQTSEAAPAQEQAFQVKALDGSIIKLSDYRGRFVLLNFWGSWCRSCEPAMQPLKEVRSAFPNDPRLVMVGLNLDDSAQQVQQWVQRYQIDWPQALLGETGSTAVPGLFGVHALPHVVLVGPDGKVIAADLHGEQILPAVQLALNNNSNPGR